ncbi:MAG TPA: glutaredoxin domain-containing protein [Chloroflexaceae bacterium]|nr:glutaredoxin domain-containing protein [Chloroflexaceae bacterium]
MTTDQNIVVYGTSWCPDCRRAQRVFELNRVPYTYVNIEDNEEAAEYVVRVNNGYRSVPTIVFPDGTIMVEPSNLELQKKLIG